MLLLQTVMQFFSTKDVSHIFPSCNTKEIFCINVRKKWRRERRWCYQNQFRFEWTKCICSYECICRYASLRIWQKNFRFWFGYCHHHLYQGNFYIIFIKSCSESIHQKNMFLPIYHLFDYLTNWVKLLNPIIIFWKFKLNLTQNI
jgi:hypothetical protein